MEVGCLKPEVIAPNSEEPRRSKEPMKQVGVFLPAPGLEVRPTPSLSIALPPVSGELGVWFLSLTAVSGLCWLLAFGAALALSWGTEPDQGGKMGHLTLLVMVGLIPC